MVSLLPGINLGPVCVRENSFLLYFFFNLFIFKFFSFCQNTNILPKPAKKKRTQSLVDVLKSLDQRIQNMVVVLIKVQKKIGLEEQMTLGKALSWTDFGVECSVF